MPQNRQAETGELPFLPPSSALLIFNATTGNTRALQRGGGCCCHWCMLVPLHFLFFLSFSFTISIFNFSFSKNKRILLLTNFTSWFCCGLICCDRPHIKCFADGSRSERERERAIKNTSIAQSRHAENDKIAYTTIQQFVQPRWQNARDSCAFRARFS